MSRPARPAPPFRSPPSVLVKKAFEGMEEGIKHMEDQDTAYEFCKQSFDIFTVSALCARPLLKFLRCPSGP